MINKEFPLHNFEFIEISYRRKAFFPGIIIKHCDGVQQTFILLVCRRWVGFLWILLWCLCILYTSWYHFRNVLATMCKFHSYYCALCSYIIDKIFPSFSMNSWTFQIQQNTVQKKKRGKVKLHDRHRQIGMEKNPPQHKGLLWKYLIEIISFLFEKRVFRTFLLLGKRISLPTLE